MGNHRVLNFLAFTCFLVIGYTLSIRFYPAGDVSRIDSNKNVTVERPSNIATLDNDQRSILLVSARAIDGTSPQLESIWLATYFPAGTTIQLLPIFPLGRKTVSGLEQQLDLSFRLSNVDGEKRLDESFLGLLQKNNYWWSGYIVFENASLVKMVNLMDGERLNPEAASRLQDLQSTPVLLDDPQNAFSSQILLFQSMCHKLSDLGTHPALEQMLTQVPSPIITDLDTSQLEMELMMLSSNHPDRTCRFPTLEISRIEP